MKYLDHTTRFPAQVLQHTAEYAGHMKGHIVGFNRKFEYYFDDAGIYSRRYTAMYRSPDSLVVKNMPIFEYHRQGLVERFGELAEKINVDIIRSCLVQFPIGGTLEEFQGMIMSWNSGSNIERPFTDEDLYRVLSGRSEINYQFDKQHTVTGVDVVVYITHAFNQTVTVNGLNANKKVIYKTAFKSVSDDKFWKRLGLPIEVLRIATAKVDYKNYRVLISLEFRKEFVCDGVTRSIREPKELSSSGRRTSEFAKMCAE